MDLLLVIGDQDSYHEREDEVVSSPIWVVWTCAVANGHPAGGTSVATPWPSSAPLDAERNAPRTVQLLVQVPPSCSLCSVRERMSMCQT